MNPLDIQQARADLTAAVCYVDTFINKNTLEFKTIPSQNDLEQLINACQYIKSEGAAWQNAHYGMILDRIRYINLN